jgi:hypothetical protein
MSKDVVSHAVIAMRQVLHQQNKGANMVKTATATTAFSHLISDQTGKGNVDAIVVPPVDIKGANKQPRSMNLVHQHQHLQSPTNSKKQKVKMCCL